MSPGPAVYDNRKSPNLSQIKSAAKVYMGCEKRKGFTDKIVVENGNPGPGNYTHDRKEYHGQKEVIQTFGNAIRDQKMEQKDSQFVPGPANYNPSFRLTSKSPSQVKLGTTTLKESYFHEQSKRNFVPGPGQYNPKDTSQLGYVHEGDQMCKSKKGLKFNINETVGPGNYNLDKVQNKQLGFTFGQEKRGVMCVNDNPAPGQYSLDTNGLNYVRPYS